MQLINCFEKFIWKCTSSCIDLQNLNYAFIKFNANIFIKCLNYFETIACKNYEEVGPAIQILWDHYSVARCCTCHVNTTL